MISVIYYGRCIKLKYATRLLNGLLKGKSPLSKSMSRKPKTRFTNLDEFCLAINALTEWLKRDGHLEDSQGLETLIHTAWTTGSELLGEIMLSLKNMTGDYSPKLRTEINECFEFALHHRTILGLGDRK
jgi:hypothetical protein